MKIINKGNKKAEIIVYEDIGEGWFGGMSAKRFAEEVKALGKVDEINVRINSPGGSVFEGIAMYNTLASHGARIVVDIDGLAASIASVFAMAGNEIRMAANGFMMIHDPWVMTAGSAAELRKQADLLDSVRGQLLNTYMRRATASEEEISAMMTEETWLTAAEALEVGLIDSVSEDIQIAASAKGFDLSKYRHVPEKLATIKPERKAGASASLLKMRSVIAARNLKTASGQRK